ncbi:DMT family transporter [Ovoidimarina sediminis]|uniref:DMT family transporter n=1 Tax=Ovoidimarina sediminis TaxID=3079856 RepID=UPI00290DF5F0|nr:multidrug efflux SMR transporter [Rhodophyticola sp. MJ-SS7]MDU8945582.1 multidrug efflux SMR transporter [Rhodophyticola sp. MJ-SS7]
MPYLYLVIAVAFETIGTSALKASYGFTKLGPSLLVVLGYAVSFYFLGLCLKVIPVGVAYAMWSGLGIILIAAIGWVLFGQRLDAAAILGLALILAGILVIHLFSKTTGH